MKYLHTMVRVADLEASLRFYRDALGLEVLSSKEVPQGRFTLVFLAAPGDSSAQVELTFNWDPEVYSGGRNFGHIAYAVDDQPEKQSRFMPHSGIPIFPSDEMRSRDQRPALVLLGVNGESEETVLSKGSIPHGTRHASVLPPSPRLLEAWSLVRAR